MLLFRPDPKPLSEIAVGESFQILVTEEDWKKADQDRGGMISRRCPLAQALKARFGGASVARSIAEAWSGTSDEGYLAFIHDGAAVVDRFDIGARFDMPRLVTFTRES